MKAKLEVLENLDNRSHSSRKSDTVGPSVTEVSAEDKTATFIRSTDFSKRPESDPNRFCVDEPTQNTVSSYADEGEVTVVKQPEIIRTKPGRPGISEAANGSELYEVNSKGFRVDNRDTNMVSRNLLIHPVSAAEEPPLQGGTAEDPPSRRPIRIDAVSRNLPIRSVSTAEEPPPRGETAEDPPSRSPFRTRVQEVVKLNRNGPQSGLVTSNILDLPWQTSDLSRKNHPKLPVESSSHRNLPPKPLQRPELNPRELSLSGPSTNEPFHKNTFSGTGKRGDLIPNGSRAPGSLGLSRPHWQIGKFTEAANSPELNEYNQSNSRPNIRSTNVNPTASHDLPGYTING